MQPGGDEHGAVDAAVLRPGVPILCVDLVGEDSVGFEDDALGEIIFLQVRLVQNVASRTCVLHDFAAAADDGRCPSREALPRKVFFQSLVLRITLGDLIRDGFAMENCMAELEGDVEAGAGLLDVV